MRGYLKNFHTIVTLAAVGALLPVVVFAQFKISESVTTVIAPTETTRLNTVTGIVAPYTAPTKSETTDALIQQTRGVAPTTQVQTTKVLSPTTGIVAPTYPAFIAPTKIEAPVTGVIAPAKTAQPSTAVTAPKGDAVTPRVAVPQKTVTPTPTIQAPTRTPTTGVTAPTIERYAAAQVMYQARNLRALQAAADASADGTAKGLPLELSGIPGVPMIEVLAERGEGITFTVSGGGTYDIRGIVLNAESAALESFRDSVFTVLLDDYENLGAVAVLITYIPEETLTFAPGTGGITLPPPTGVTPVAPVAPAAPAPVKPIAVQPITPEVHGAPGKVFELTYQLVALSEAPEEPGFEEPEEPFEEPGDEEEEEESDEFFDEFDLGVEGEDEIAFVGDEGEEGEEGEEFFEGEPDEFFAFEGEPEEAPVFDFTDFGVSPDEFVGEEEIGDLGFGFDFGDLALAPEEDEEFAAEEEFFEEDASAPVVPDVAVADGNVNVQLSLNGLFEFGETPLVVSLGFASGAKQLTFSNPIDSDLAATFTVSTAVLSSLGSSDLDVLLTLQSVIDGFPIIDTYVLGSIKL